MAPSATPVVAQRAEPAPYSVLGARSPHAALDLCHVVGDSNIQHIPPPASTATAALDAVTYWTYLGAAKYVEAAVESVILVIQGTVQLHKERQRVVAFSAPHVLRCRKVARVEPHLITTGERLRCHL